MQNQFLTQSGNRVKSFSIFDYAHLPAFASMSTHKTDEMPTRKKPDLSKAASYNIQLGLGYLKQGDRPRAKKKLLTALKQEPNSADANAAMAYYFEQTSELEQARSII